MKPAVLSASVKRWLNFPKMILVFKLGLSGPTTIIYAIVLPIPI